MSIRDIFSDPNFTYSSKIAKPIRLYGNKVEKTGAVVVFKGGGGDYALSVEGVEKLLGAKNEERVVEAHIVLAHDLKNGGDPVVVAIADAEEVYEPPKARAAA